MLISLVEWAAEHGIDPSTARQRALRGAFKTAKKIGRNWVIEDYEDLIDHRYKKSHPSCYDETGESGEYEKCPECRYFKTCSGGRFD